MVGNFENIVGKKTKSKTKGKCKLITCNPRRNIKGIRS